MDLKVVYGLPKPGEEIETIDLGEDSEADLGPSDLKPEPPKKRGQRQKSAPASVIR